MSLGQWQWRPTPPDQGRDFGNANVFATPPTLETLVRETGQNSLDAAVDGGRIVMRFKLIELSKGTELHDAFSEGVGLQALLEHAEAAAVHKQKIGARLRSGIEEFNSSNNLMLLRVDDYGTTGLYGSENPRGDERNPYYSLIRNNLDTSKATSTAGGSYGLGKAVNWSLSSLLTVVVASDIHPKFCSERQQNRFRISGKAELPWHETAEGAFAGPGWFSAPGSEYHSIWVPRETLQSLQLDRDHFLTTDTELVSSGTSLLIVGFQNPSRRSSGAETVRELKRVAAENFWPAMLAGQLSVHVEYAVDGKTNTSGEVNPREYVPSFCEAYERYASSGLSTSEPEPGDTVKHDVELALMPTKGNQREVEPLAERTNGDTHLVVRIAPKEGIEADTAWRDHVALIRGRLMVVKYLAKRNLLVGGQPFHALLLAGTAAIGARNARNVEEFLRAAEPPAHDQWEYSPDLSAIYKPGTGERIKEYFDRVTSELKRIIRPPRGDRVEGPLELRRMLQTAKSGTPGSKPGPSLHALNAVLRDGRWQVSGAVSAPDVILPVVVYPRLFLEVESGKSIPLEWDGLTVDSGSTDKDQGILIETSTSRVAFKGKSKDSAKGVPASASRLGIAMSWKSVNYDD